MTELGIPIHLNTTAWGIFPDKVIGAACGQTPAVFKPKAVIIATGASENSLPFPGWTLPGIMGAGAAQTLINYHRVRPGNRALVVGAGNVGLIVSYQLLQAGIEVVAVVEAMENVGGYMVHGAKIRRMGVPIHTRHTIVKAEGTDRVSRATIVALDESSQPIEGTEKAFDIDMICVAVGLSPAAELCRVLRARMEYVAELGGWVPLHNQSLLTSVDGVFVAGDVSGVEEASAAMEEGKLAAVSAAESLGQLSKEQAQLKKEPLRQSLNQLRTGPFGKMVGQKKESIFARFNEDG